MMGKIKRLATENDTMMMIRNPVSPEELAERERAYPLMPDNRFATKFKGALYQPIAICYHGKEYEFKLNFCTNPYCKNFGKPQVRFDTKGKPRRYKLASLSSRAEPRIQCNPDPTESTVGTALDCANNAISNWGVAEEVRRLAKINSLSPMEPDYQFHRDNCETKETTPFSHKEKFLKRGRSSGNSQKYQCKSCKKMTNVLPSTKESTTYHQKRNDILPRFAELVTNKVPVSRVVEILDIGVQTYYAKLEWLYKKCLEFNQRHELKLKEKEFDELWINTDKMVYYLNNLRKKNAGSNYLMEQEEKQFPTHVVISSDMISRYVFRGDLAYDWDITLEEISNQTKVYKDDHLHLFAQRYGHLRIPFAPQPPTEYDRQTRADYENSKKEFDRRAQYIDGLHTNSTYTSIAHFWHLKQLVNAKEWRFSSDDDASIMSALMRVFADEINVGDAHHFIYKIDKSKTRRGALRDYQDARAILKDWAFHRNITNKNVTEMARLMLAEELATHNFFEVVEKKGKKARKWARNPIEHPLPFKDAGYATVDCTTDVRSYEPIELARMIQKINNKSTDTFINQIRRRTSILERPLTTSKGDGKSYIYANFNPKYAQYAITILRTYYNFCMPYKAYGKLATPAQRIGITDKVFKWEDIIYFR